MVNNDTGLSSDSWTEKFLDVMETRTGTIPYFTCVFTDEETAAQMFRMHETFAVLYIPDGFGESIKNGNPLSLSVKFTAAHEISQRHVRLWIGSQNIRFRKAVTIWTPMNGGYHRVRNLQNDSPSKSSYMMAGILIWTIGLLRIAELAERSAPMKKRVNRDLI